MKNNIGTFIRDYIAAIVAIFVTAPSLCGGIYLISTDKDNLILGLGIIIGGIVLGLVAGILISGFGELINKACEIERNTRGSNSGEEESQNDNSAEPCNADPVSTADTYESSMRKEDGETDMPAGADDPENAMLLKLRAKGLITEQEYLETLKRKNKAKE